MSALPLKADIYSVGFRWSGEHTANCLHYWAVRAANSIAREIKGDEIATPRAKHIEDKPERAD